MLFFGCRRSIFVFVKTAGVLHLSNESIEACQRRRYNVRPSVGAFLALAMRANYLTSNDGLEAQSVRWKDCWLGPTECELRKEKCRFQQLHTQELMRPFS